MGIKLCASTLIGKAVAPLCWPLIKSLQHKYFSQLVLKWHGEVSTERTEMFEREEFVHVLETRSSLDVLGKT